jgi:C4-dicarboxylate-specific signal transduction histidine kinase
VRASCERELTALVAGGALTLRRILTNLVLNACEGDGARVACCVDIRARASSPDRIAIEIIDDGPGFLADALSAPLGGSPSTKRAGTGVGLGLVDALVKSSGGSCQRDNLESGGGCFIVELPAAPPRA